MNFGLLELCFGLGGRLGLDFLFDPFLRQRQG